MTDIDISILHSHDGVDSVPLQYLGASVAMHLNAIPADVRAKIYETATGSPIAGLPTITDLKEAIDRLIRNNSGCEA